MSTFVDGPAAGVTLLFGRAPVYLRVVRGPAGWDVLDRLDDEPSADEQIFVYRRIGEPVQVHVNGRGTKTPSGFYAIADYVHVEVDGESLRSTEAWREWGEGRAA